jgi:DNA-binding transcriptional regulator YiaG
LLGTVRGQQNSETIWPLVLDRVLAMCYTSAMSKGNHLKQLRRVCKNERGTRLTQAEAAVMFGVSHQTVQAWEQGYYDTSSNIPKYIAALRALRTAQKGAAK